MYDFLEYDEERFVPTCATCDAENSFKRYRVLHEQQILDLEGGVAEIADTDQHEQNEWTFECDRCGTSSDELEDLLSELPDDEEEGDDDV